MWGCLGLGLCVYIWFQFGLGCSVGWVPYVVVGGGVLIRAFSFCVLFSTGGDLWLVHLFHIIRFCI